MSLKNQKLFGLNVQQNFADVLDKDAALRNLGINPLDLSVIYNASKGTDNLSKVSAFDWRSFSNLSVPIWKLLDRYSGDSSTFESYLETRAGINNLLFGDLDVNGVLSGSAIRYRYLKGTGSTAYVALADISTSRVSAWSSSDPRANSNDEVTDSNFNNGDKFFPVQRLATISYGSRIKIKYRDNVNNTISGRRGLLRFGEQGSSTYSLTSNPPTYYNDTAGNGNSNSGATGRRLQTTLTPIRTEFDSEIPTSKIKIHLDGDVHYLYAMKGIPLTFRGFFRSLDNVECVVSSITADGQNLLPSWKVVRVDNRNDYSNYRNQNIGRYRSSRSRERFIELYYPADKILSIKAQSANIEEIPVAKFNSLVTFNLANNNISNFPNFNDITPSMTRFYMHNNPLYLSETRSERVLSQEITNKLPTTLLEITLGKTFNGSIERNIFADRFPNLTNLDLYRGSGVRFGPDDNDKTVDSNGNEYGTCTVPNFGSDLKNINIQYNDFRQFDPTGTNTSAASYTFNGYYESGTDYIYNCSNTHKMAPGAVLSGTGIQTDTKITRIKGNVVTVDKTITSNSGGTTSPSQVNITVTSQDNTGRFSVENSTTLETINLYGNYYLSKSGFSIDANNKAIKSINMGNTNLPIPSLDNKPLLTTFSNQYNRSKTSFFINENHDTGNYSGYKFEGSSNLQRIYCYGSGGIKGPLPRFNGPELIYIDLRNTGITGGVEGIDTANQLTQNGEAITAQTFANCGKLVSLYLYSPMISGLTVNSNAFSDLVSLENLQLHTGERVGGALPSFTTLSKLRYFYFHGNAFTGNLPTFSSSPNIRYIYLYNNQLSGSIAIHPNLSSLQRLYLHQNRRGSSEGFTALSEFIGLNSLDRFYCHYNSIEGTIPSFAGCPNIRYLSLYENKFNNYTSTSIVSLGRLRYFDVSYCQLTATAIDNIIYDCYLNYENSKRGNVTIELRNNFINGNRYLEDGVTPAPQQHTGISEESQEYVELLKAAGWKFQGFTS